MKIFATRKRRFNQLRHSAESPETNSSRAIQTVRVFFVQTSYFSNRPRITQKTLVSYKYFPTKCELPKTIALGRPDLWLYKQRKAVAPDATRLSGWDIRLLVPWCEFKRRKVNSLTELGEAPTSCRDMYCTLLPIIWLPQMWWVNRNVFSVPEFYCETPGTFW